MQRILVCGSFGSVQFRVPLVAVVVACFLAFLNASPGSTTCVEKEINDILLF